MKKNLLAENMRRFGTKNLKTNLTESYSSSDDFDGTGLIVQGRTQIDNNEIADFVDASDYHGLWNAKEGYWFFPEDEETLDGLEMELSREFDNRGINYRIEGQFNVKSKLNKNTIHIPNLSWQDQTRIIKWLNQQDYDLKDYKVIEKGDDITIDTFGLDRSETKEIKSYLKSQNYKFSSNL